MAVAEERFAPLVQIEEIRRSVVFGILMVLLSGCSVGMAVAGDEQPDLSVALVGTTKAEIDTEFGAPVEIKVREDDGADCLYIFVLGDEPSYSRAVLHAGLDVFSLGLWELAGTPIEKAVEETQEYWMTVVYDADATVKSVQLKRTGSGRSP